MTPVPTNPVAERLIAELAEALHADDVVRGIIREVVEREVGATECWPGGTETRAVQRITPSAVVASSAVFGAFYGAFRKQHRWLVMEDEGKRVFVNDEGRYSGDMAVSSGERHGSLPLLKLFV